MEAFVSTDVGMKRRINEDNFCVNMELGLFVVADGMGGHAAGEVASRIAVEEIEASLNRTLKDEEVTYPGDFDPNMTRASNMLRAAILAANEKIRGTTQNMSETRGMGTTIVAAVIGEMSGSIAHVGDSRAYLFRQDELRALTSDHSWVNEQLKQGFITLEHARTHPFRNVITQALGSGSDVRVDSQEVHFQTGDLLLLCSDGLNSMLSDFEMARLLRERKFFPLDQICSDLIEGAKQKGGDDNITVALIRFTKPV
ncbi:MAG: Stp1/IreP family PP2C-type Ser/Thr phosphatase [Acidobacteria bacterium]|nr:Stp1/IreP family PP2C-type Ser/Thr phosphatase [Acidobacteriota bacterium]MCB9396925.1 Stp1/IreP family PP2C-type Ser/Thr phosphatase [Acidobacteriota bacterium]